MEIWIDGGDSCSGRKGGEEEVRREGDQEGREGKSKGEEKGGRRGREGRGKSSTKLKNQYWLIIDGNPTYNGLFTSTC